MTVECPKCKDKRIAGLVAAFWVLMQSNGEPRDVSWESQSELTPTRMCIECGHKWEDGEDDGS